LVISLTTREENGWRASVEGGSLDTFDGSAATFLPATRPGFTLVNVFGAYALSPRIQLTARIEDIADPHYQEALGYGEPKRMILFGIRAKD
jgi:vitamin B12 transporter